MTELITEILIFLGVAALLGLLIGYLLWGWGRRSAIESARSEGAASARTSVDGSAALRDQLKACEQERDRLERELDLLRSHLDEEEDTGTADENGKTATSVVAPEIEVASEVKPDPEPEPDPPEPLPVAAPAAAAPATLLTERPDEVDDLKRIKGVGPKMEGILNDKGVYLFRQLANFSTQDVAWVNEAISAFPGRIQRDDWVGQAQKLYHEKYGKAHDAPD